MNGNGEKQPRTFLSVVNNIWYYYKWHIIIGLCAVIMFTIASVQYFSKVAPDVFFYYVGQSSATAKDIEEFCDDMQNIMPKDYNGDGKKKVDYKEDIFVMYSIEDGASTGSYVYNSTDQLDIVKRFNMELGMGECLIYIMEPNLFSANTDYIAPLDSVLDKVPENALSGKGIKLSDLGAYRKTALSSFPSDYVICLRAKRSGDDIDFYNTNADFFKTLVEYR